MSIVVQSFIPNPARLLERRPLRIVHLLFAITLGIGVYSPLSGSPAGRLVVALVAVPGLAVTGALLLKGAAMRRRLRDSDRATLGLPAWLLGLVALALVLGLGHHVDHVVRGNHVGWPLTDQVTVFTVSLLSYPAVLAGLYLSWRGRVRARFWVLLSVVLAAPVVLSHFGPTAVEPPADIIGVYDHHAAGLVAFGWLVFFTVVLAMLVVAAVAWWRSDLSGAAQA